MSLSSLCLVSLVATDYVQVKLVTEKLKFSHCIRYWLFIHVAVDKTLPSVQVYYIYYSVFTL